MVICQRHFEHIEIPWARNIPEMLHCCNYIFLVSCLDDVSRHCIYMYSIWEAFAAKLNNYINKHSMYFVLSMTNFFCAMISENLLTICRETSLFDQTLSFCFNVFLHFLRFSAFCLIMSIFCFQNSFRFFRFSQKRPAFIIISVFFVKQKKK